MSAPKYRPGQAPEVSGQYAVRGPRGGDTGLEVTHVSGDRLPPTPKPGMQYELVDRTKHKN